MLRLIFIFFTLFALTACSQDDATTQYPKTDKLVKEDRHDDHKSHKDEEHHGSSKEIKHDEHDEHKDEEHHKSGKDNKRDGHDNHADEEHHIFSKAQKHDDNDKHQDDEHHSIDKNNEHSDHGNEGEESGHDEEGTVHLKPEQIKTAGIVVESLVPRSVNLSVKAPGEIKLNAYRTYKVSPRINAQAIERHAKLGDEVTEGQPLVTLSSVEMAEAQGQLLLADKEWKRMKKLGRKVVSERRYITAKVDYDKAYANARAYGMNESDIKALLSHKRTADGSFRLVAQQAGRILHDDFIIGERLEAGYELMVISDESAMWVEARVTPDIAGQIDVGNAAEILLRNQRLSAKVIQLHHTLDETTRTAAVRIEVPNKDDQLHGGMFVTALITTRNQSDALQVPEAAVLRSPDGDWQVMVEQEETGEFKAVEVKVVNITNGIAVIEGVKPGTRVVTQGAFFVQSELAKGGFDIHNH